MSTILRSLRAVAATLSLCVGLAHAGGPLSVCTPGTAVKYPGSVTLRYDGGGNLGVRPGSTGTVRTKADADAIVNAAIAMWNNVSTATINLVRGTDLPGDITLSNYTTYVNNFSNAQYSDGINPVLYDNDGSITDDLLGVGATSAGVLGFAGSAWSGCSYVEGSAVINGGVRVSDNTMTTVIAHELGHFIGMDHTQLDGTQGLTSSNYPLMYPFAARTLLSLHEDDIAAVTALYPTANYTATYGEVNGTFTLANGSTIVPGANIWARNISTNQVYSVVSGYLGTAASPRGTFRFLLPAGTYRFFAEAIASDFTGGSSVGPYSESVSGLSFRSPLYTSSPTADGNGNLTFGGTPMAGITLGGMASPTQVTVTAGCTATMTFRIDGQGTVSGCSTTPSGPVQAAATMVSPSNGATLTGASQTFTWTASNATNYQIWVGTAVGTSNLAIAPAGGTTGTSTTVTGLPTDGRTLYVRLYSLVNGAYESRDYTYTAANTAPVPQPAAFTSPMDGATLAGASQLFQWNAAAGASLYQVWVGNSQGAYDLGYYPAEGTTGTSTTINGLPTDGRMLYVRLYTSTSVGWIFRDFTFRAANLAVPAAILSPAPGSTLGGASQLFTWESVTGAGLYQLWVGTSLGAYDLGYSPGGLATSHTMTGLPTDGRTLYVRLYTNIGGTYYSRDYTYTAATAQLGAAITSPAAGSTLGGSSATFEWNNVGASFYQLWVGSTPGGYDFGYSPASSATSATMAGLPTDGRTLYVRLYSNIAGVYHYRDFTYTAASASPAAVITSPANGATINGTSRTFQWTDVGASFYQLWVGTTPGGYDLGYSPASSTTSATMTGLPANGTTIYVRLYSNVGGVYHFRDYSYTSAP